MALVARALVVNSRCTALTCTEDCWSRCSWCATCPEWLSRRCRDQSRRSVRALSHTGRWLNHGDGHCCHGSTCLWYCPLDHSVAAPPPSYLTRKPTMSHATRWGTRWPRPYPRLGPARGRLTHGRLPSLSSAPPCATNPILRHRNSSVVLRAPCTGNAAGGEVLWLGVGSYEGPF